MKVDLNCDMGEGIGNEQLIMPYISSCNIACGGHFGDAKTIDNIIEIALKNEVLMGAHPSFPDPENFGRKKLLISDKELTKSIQNQLSLMSERLAFFNQKMHHIKPHGALYNLIASNFKAATLFVTIIQDYTKDVFLYVPYHSVIEKVALKNKLQIKYEAFADRTYNDDLTLVSRSHKNAIITNKEAVLKQVINMVKNKQVQTLSGVQKNIKADTFCVHSDTKNAEKIIPFLATQLQKEGYNIGL